MSDGKQEEMVLKLYIVGPVASGKTTLARQVSRKTGVPCFHLDQVAHEPDPDRPGPPDSDRILQNNANKHLQVVFKTI